jgi:hypothetical protein
MSLILPFLYIGCIYLKDRVWNYLSAQGSCMKYNKVYKNEDKDVTKENSFVYVEIKSIMKCMYKFDVWNIRSNIVEIRYSFC